MVLKSRPQDIEYNPGLLVMLALLFLGSGVFALSRTVQYDTALYGMMLELILMFVFIAGCLSLLRLSQRLVQTITALLGTGIIFHCLMWPVILEMSDDSISDTVKTNLSLAFLMLLSWQVLVNAHIYRHAFSVDMTKAIVLSIAFWVMSMALSQILFPAP